MMPDVAADGHDDAVESGPRAGGVLLLRRVSPDDLGEQAVVCLHGLLVASIRALPAGLHQFDGEGAPNRPRPITATECASAIRRAVSANRANLANDGPLLREFVQAAAVAEGEAERSSTAPAGR